MKEEPINEEEEDIAVGEIQIEPPVDDTESNDMDINELEEERKDDEENEEKELSKAEEVPKVEKSKKDDDFFENAFEEPQS